MDFILSMDVDEGREMIIKAYEKQNEDKAYQLYLMKYPDMTQENFIPFDEFYKPNRKEEKHQNESAEDILSNVRKMMDSNEWR